MAAVAGVVLLAGLTAGGCASHKFVRENLAEVDTRVTGVDTRVTEVAGTAGDERSASFGYHESFFEHRQLDFGRFIPRNHQGFDRSCDQL